MKTNLIRRIAIAICLLSCISIYSCKKDNSSGTGNNTTNVATESDDQSQVSSESDNVTDDANTSLNGQASFSGNSSSSASLSGSTAVNSVDANTMNSSFVDVHHLICDATVTYDTSNNQRVITIVYDGTNCWGNRTRTGTVTVTMPVGQHWKDAGATATIAATNLKITRVRDGKAIQISGSKTFTNVSGGLLTDLATLGTITHTVTSPGISVTFDNGSTRVWQVAKQRVYTYDSGVVVTITGTYSDGTNTGIAEWGTNRNGNSFKSIISAPKVIRQSCDFRLVSGQNTVVKDNGTSVITFGLDANGNATGCPGTGGTFYFKLVWTGSNGQTFTIIRPY